MSKKVNVFLPGILFGATSLLLADFLWWHWKLGLTRFFDVDEFAHLHWARLMAIGERPYLDFFFFFPPGFQWFLTPLFWFGRGVTPFISGRILQFFEFSTLVGLVMYLFWYLRRSWLFMVAGAVLTFLPLPFDKFLEVRPDTLGAILVVLGIIEELGWLKDKKATQGFFAGFFYSLSLIVLPKSLPSVAVALIIMVLAARDFPTKIVGQAGTIFWRQILSPLVGLAVPLIIFGLWALTLGNLDVVIYSLFKLPFEVNRISQIFFMAPDLFFYPNSSFYGTRGWSQGLLVNHALWVVGLAVGSWRLLTPYLALKEEQRRGALGELLVASIFIVGVTYYVLWSPLKHAQYLIPIAVFIAFYVTDGLWVIWEKTRGQWGAEVFFGIAFLLGGLLLYQTNLLTEGPKLTSTNTGDLANIKLIYTTIPTSKYILDLDGRTLYYPSPYYVCCLPFGEYASFISRPLPSLSQALEKTQTSYIWQGQLERVKMLLPEDQAYIGSHYQASADTPGLLVRFK